MQTNIPRGTVQITLTNAAQYLIMGLFYIIVTKTNTLTQQDIGALSVLSFLSSTIILITTLALPTALTKFTSEKIGKNDPKEAASIRKTITKTVMTLSLIVFTAASLLSSQISQTLLGSSNYIDLIILTLIYTTLYNIITLYNSTLQAIYLFGEMATVTLTYITVSRATAVTLTLLNMGLKGVLVGYIAGAVAAIAIAAKFTRGKLPKTNHPTPLKPILKFSLPLFITNLTILTLNWADIIILSLLTQDYSQTGIYYITLNSVSALSILWIPITTTIFPALSEKHGLKRPEEITDMVKTSSRYLTYITVPTCIGLAAVSPTALTFFYGPNYRNGAAPLTILSIATIIVAAYSLFATALTAIGKTNQILKINIIAAITTITLLTLTVPILKTTGAALTRLTTQLIALTLAIHLLKKEIKVKIDKEALWKSTLASTATIPILLTTEKTLNTKLPATQTFIAEVVVAAITYTAALRALKALKHRDFQLLKQALPKTLTKYINIIEKIAT